MRQAVFINDETLNLTKAFLRQHQVDVDSNIIDLGGQITEREATMPRTQGEIGAELNLRRYYQILLSLKREEPYTSISEVEKLFNASPLNPRSKLMKFSSFGSIGLPDLLLKTDPRGEIVEKRGNPVPDTDLRDTENVPLTEDVERYFAREVLPYAPDAWIDEKKTKIGYEIPMTRYFYEYQAPEKTEDIMARITALEQEISRSLQALFHKEG